MSRVRATCQNVYFWAVRKTQLEIPIHPAKGPLALVGRVSSTNVTRAVAISFSASATAGRSESVAAPSSVDGPPAPQA